MEWLQAALRGSVEQRTIFVVEEQRSKEVDVKRDPAERKIQTARAERGVRKSEQGGRIWVW